MSSEKPGRRDDCFSFQISRPEGAIIVFFLKVGRSYSVFSSFSIQVWYVYLESVFVSQDKRVNPAGNGARSLIDYERSKYCAQAPWDAVLLAGWWPLFLPLVGAVGTWQVPSTGIHSLPILLVRNITRGAILLFEALLSPHYGSEWLPLVAWRVCKISLAKKALVLGVGFETNALSSYEH